MEPTQALFRARQATSQVQQKMPALLALPTSPPCVSIVSVSTVNVPMAHALVGQYAFLAIFSLDGHI